MHLCSTWLTCMIFVQPRYDMYVNNFHCQSNSHPSMTSPKKGHTYSQLKHATHPYSLSGWRKFPCHQIHPFKYWTCCDSNLAKRAEKCPQLHSPISLPSFDQSLFANAHTGLHWSIACAPTPCGTVELSHTTLTISCSSLKVSTPYSPSTSFSLQSLPPYSDSCLSLHILSHTSTLSASICYLPWVQTVHNQEKLLCMDW